MRTQFLYIWFDSCEIQQPAQAMLVQNFSMPEVCEGFRGWEECPDFLDEQQWQFYTATCCGGHSALVFHCQEQYIKHKRHVVTGCLQSTTCDSGMWLSTDTVTRGIETALHHHHDHLYTLQYMSFAFSTSRWLPNTDRRSIFGRCYAWIDVS